MMSFFIASFYVEFSLAVERIGNEVMKKYFSIALMVVVAVILGGCGGNAHENKVPKKSSDEIAAVLLKDSFWVMDSGDMPYLNDAISRKDIDYLKQLMIEGKVFYVDRDTKVTRFGIAADKNNVLIIFNEGRYTNKTGCTHASNVIDEKDFPTYAESQKKKIVDLIQKCLTNTENYSEAISIGDLAEIEILKSVCLNDTNVLKSKAHESDSYTRKCLQKAVKIIFERDFALSAYKSSVEYSSKAKQADSRSKNSRVYDSMAKDFSEDVNKHSQEAERLRQDFRAEYGF